MVKKASFEEAIVRLEDIIKELEEEQKPLDEMLSLYAEGIKLLATCRKQLDQAAVKMQVLETEENS
ncbi:MAG: exodeoxyribonuclease VII small subunit [Bacillota bacterium]